MFTITYRLTVIASFVAISSWPSWVFGQFPNSINLGNFAEHVRIQGTKEESFGWDLAIGDFNGDGYADILAGAPNYSVREDLRFDIGRAYIIFQNKTQSPIIDFQDREGNRGVMITGDDPRDYTGFTVSAGDINGDGITDAIVGTSQFTHPVARGKTYIVYGRTNWPEEISLDTDGNPVEGVTRLIGKQSGEGLGEITATGDINGDGYCDLITGAPAGGDDHQHGKAGEVYVFYGKPSLPPIVAIDDTLFEVTTIHGSDEWRIGEFGSVFDIDRDGFSDILLGNTLYGEVPGKGWAGGCLILFGSAQMPSHIYTSSAAISSFRATAVVGAEGDRLGFRTSVGDLNGNGINDLLVASKVKGGKVYVLFDISENMAESEVVVKVIDYVPKLTLKIESDISRDFVFSDVNNDRIPDMLAGSGYEDVNQWRNAGRVFLIYGSNSLDDFLDLTSEEGRSRATQILGYQGNLVGHAVASGDVNDDDINDIIIGAPRAQSATGRWSGEVYVIYGRSAKITPPAFEKARLLQSFPNPFNANTVIRYELEQTQHIQMSIYNARGQKITQLVDGVMPAGEHRAIWNGHDANFRQVGSGVYFCRIVGETFTQSIKLLYLK